MNSIFSLVRSISTFSLLTFFSRILGLIRDILFARYFGASIYLDIFVVAFKIPNFFRRIFAEGIISQVFLPHFAELQSQSTGQLQRFVDTLLFWQIVILLIFLGSFFLFYDYLVYLLAPGFANDGMKKSLLLGMMYLTMPYLFFTSLMALFGALLNLKRNFFVVAAAPVFLNISFLIAIIWGRDYFDVPENILAHAVFWGGVCQFIFILIPLYRSGFRLQLIYQPIGVFFRSFAHRFWPVLLALSVTQLNLFIDIWMASFLPPGRISWLYYADRLFQFPIGVFSVALSTVVLSEMSLNVGHGALDKAKQNLSFGLELGFLIGLPAAVGLFFLSEPIIHVLFFSKGSFVKNDVLMSAYALSAYSLGLLPWILSKLLINALHVHQKGKWVTKVALLGLFTNIIFNAILMHFFGHIGLALATSLSGILQSVVFIKIALKHRLMPPFRWAEGFKIILCTLIMLGIIVMLKNVTLSGTQHQIIHLLFILITPAIFIYMLGGYLLKIQLIRKWVNEAFKAIRSNQR